jgi:hypothetical protein
MMLRIGYTLLLPSSPQSVVASIYPPVSRSATPAAGSQCVMRGQLVLRLSPSTLRHVGQSFLTGVLAGLLWALWWIPRRRINLLPRVG